MAANAIIYRDFTEGTISVKTLRPWVDSVDCQVPLRPLVLQWQSTVVYLESLFIEIEAAWHKVQK
jgi:hypothetical protein